MVRLMSWNELRQDEKQENSVSRLKTLLITKGVLNKCYQYWILIKNTSQISTKKTQLDNLVGKYVSSFCNISSRKCFILIFCFDYKYYFCKTL